MSSLAVATICAIKLCSLTALCYAECGYLHLVLSVCNILYHMPLSVSTESGKFADTNVYSNL